MHVVKGPAITSGERRLLAVVLLGRAMAGADPGPSEEALRRAIGPYGGRLEPLAEGSTLVVLKADRQVATDQAAQAARCALTLRVLARDRPMALAMGRAESTGKLPGGDVLDRALRLVSQAANAPGDPPPIALDATSAGLLDARFDVIEREDGMILRGEHALNEGMRPLLGRPPAYIGRTWELNALTGILEECIAEPRAGAVMVIAEPGMGKSRLGAEFVRRVQERHGEVSIWVGRGDSRRTGSTFDLLGQVLRGVFGIRGDEPLPERRDKIRSRVVEHVAAGDQDRVTEFLGELVGAPFPGDGEVGAALRAARQSARLMSEQMHRAWLDFLQAETRAHPVLFLLEDLHWSDFGTLRFIETALREQRHQPWMVLALGRPDVFEIFPRLWAGRKDVQEIRLQRLGRQASERLVRHVLGDGVEPATMERLVHQADGNVFYLEELIRAVAERKGAALPETVLAMAETGLARLPLESRRVLRAASVFGEVCWDGGVVVLLGGAIEAVAASTPLTKLVEQELLVARPESRLSGERELAFRHALVREAAYLTLLEADRKLGHLLAGEWLEQHQEADPRVVAGHFERGGEPARAARYSADPDNQMSLHEDVPENAQALTPARARPGKGDAEKGRP